MEDILKELINEYDNYIQEIKNNRSVMVPSDINKFIFPKLASILNDIELIKQELQIGKKLG